MKKKSNVLPEQYISALSKALELRRKALGLSQDEVAERVGIHRTYMSLIERGAANFSIKIYLRLALALDLEPIELMGIAENRVNGAGRRKA